MEGANGISRPTTDSLPAYVMVKGVKIQVDIGKLPDRENETLTKEKHVKPARRPLDTPSCRVSLQLDRRSLEDAGTGPYDTKKSVSSYA